MERRGTMELDIRGKSADEGVYEMEAFIDNAVLSGLNMVTIIHGKGTGILRTAIHQRLKSMKSVKSFRLGLYGEGEKRSYYCGVEMMNEKKRKVNHL